MLEIVSNSLKSRLHAFKWNSNCFGVCSIRYRVNFCWSSLKVRGRIPGFGGVLKNHNFCPRLKLRMQSQWVKFGDCGPPENAPKFSWSTPNENYSGSVFRHFLGIFYIHPKSALIGQNDVQNLRLMDNRGQSVDISTWGEKNSVRPFVSKRLAGKKHIPNHVWIISVSVSDFRCPPNVTLLVLTNED